MAGLRVFYGGTFDPVHCGHLAIACIARDALHTQIALLPAADPPHRPAPGASAGERAQMLRLAIAGEPDLHVDSRELERGGRSYSIDTLHSLREEYGPRAPIALLLGADSFLDLPQWKDWRQLFDLAHIVVASRAGSALDAGLPPELAVAVQDRDAGVADALHARPCGLVLCLGQALQSQSASDVRERIAAGLPWRQLLPAAVADYIQDRGLYGASAGAAADVNGP